MSLVRVTFPLDTPVAGDWALITELVSKGFQNVNSPLQVIDGVIPGGATFQIGGVVYHGSSDTTISGTASKFVKLIPSTDGSVLTAEYSASLTGVTWNKVYNGYYDTSYNLYIFNESEAMADGLVSALTSKYLPQNEDGDVIVGRDLEVKRDLSVGDDLTVTDDATIGGNLVVTGTLDAPTLNTGQGDNELYDMNQNVKTTSSPTFSSPIFTIANTGSFYRRSDFYATVIGGGTVSQSNAKGYYIRIGNLVYVSGFVQVNSYSVGADYVKLTLPFAVNGTGTQPANFSCNTLRFTVNKVIYNLLVTGSTTYGYLLVSNGTDYYTEYLKFSDMGMSQNDPSISFSVIYECTP